MIPAYFNSVPSGLPIKILLPDLRKAQLKIEFDGLIQVDMNPKQRSGKRAADYVNNGMVVGLGTGSTAYFAIVTLGERVQKGLQITGVPTSEQSREVAAKAGIPLTTFSEISEIDLTIDGADEVDSAFNLIKGGGGALLREKIVASASKLEIIVVDESKIKHRLGAFPLPVEVLPFGWQRTRSQLQNFCDLVVIREAGAEPFCTDNGNFILDCHFNRIDDPTSLERQINAICGVIECGFFVDLAHRIIIGKIDGSLEERTDPQPL